MLSKRLQAWLNSVCSVQGVGIGLSTPETKGFTKIFFPQVLLATRLFFTRLSSLGNGPITVPQQTMQPGFGLQHLWRYHAMERQENGRDERVYGHLMSGPELEGMPQLLPPYVLLFFWWDRSLLWFWFCQSPTVGMDQMTTLLLAAWCTSLSTTSQLSEWILKDKD